MTPLDSARAAYAQGNLPLAERILGQAVAGPEELLLHGVTLARLQKPTEAMEKFSQLLQVDPNNFDALTWMAILSKNRPDSEASTPFALKAMQLHPERATAHSTLGECFLAKRQMPEAIKAFTNAISISPEVAQFHHNLGLAYQLHNCSAEAILAFRRALELAPSEPASYLSLSSQLLKHARVGEAIECLQSGLEHLPGSVPLAVELAKAYSQARNSLMAESLYKKALSISPSARGAYALWLQDEGRFAESTALYEDMLKENPAQGLAYYGLTQIRKLSELEDGIVERMESLQKDATLRPRESLFLNYALGKAYEQQSQYQRAMDSFDEANRLAHLIYNAGVPFDHATMSEDNTRLLEKQAAISGSPYSGSLRESPIFIVGMIRSGTTLLEQIVSSHPMVSLTGELRFWLEEGPRLLNQDSIQASEMRDVADKYLGYAGLLGANTARFTDKMPLNFSFLGLIRQIFPYARFLHIRRNPIDTCLSIYMTHFGAGPQFAYNRENIVFYYQQYLRIMEHWRATLPTSRFMELDYEDLVGNREEVTRQIIDFCGLPWDDACLHHEENRSVVSTPSRWQARQPIYRTSTEKWRRYGPWLGTFENLLQPQSKSL